MDIRFLYLDESGDPGWTRKHGGNSNCQYFVYAGVVLDGEQNFQARDALQKVIDDYFNSWIKPEEIHYADIVHGNNEWDELSPSERDNVRDDLFDVLLDLEPTLMGTAIDKDALKEEYGQQAHNPKSLALRSTIDRFNKDLKRNDQVGSVTIDSADRAIDRSLRKMVHDARRSGIKVSAHPRDSKVEHVVDSISMTPSEMSPGIQLADIVAYQVYNKYNYSGTSHGFQSISHLFEDPPGTSHTEPGVFPDR